MGNLHDLTGQRIGHLVAIKRAPDFPSKGNRTAWLCRCDCGKEITVRAVNLIRKSPSVTSCGCYRALSSSKRKLKDYTGLRIGRLVVIERIPTSKQGTKYWVEWLCHCDCGKKVIVCASNLRRSRKTIGTSSCGCLAREVNSQRLKKPRAAPGEAAFRKLMYRYRSNAKVRGLSFLLSDDEAKSLFQQDCHYCGQLPTKVSPNPYSPLLYNGIDRIDNSQGYVTNNVLPCCHECNMLRGRRTYESFMAWISRVIAFRTRGDLSHSCNRTLAEGD